MLLDKDAVAAPQQVLNAQLQAMDCLDPSLAVLQQQQQMKREAREEKASKLLAKGALSAAMPSKIYAIYKLNSSRTRAAISWHVILRQEQRPAWHKEAHSHK